MPVTGRKPSKGPVRHRVKPTYEWVEVVDASHKGGPSLPTNVPRKDRDWSSATKTWWAIVSSMPHCVLWTDSDWRFALDTAIVYEDFLENPTKGAAALLAREKVLGTTVDFRRDLRIRYVEAAPETGDDPSVAQLDEYRSRLAGLDETADT